MENVRILTKENYKTTIENMSYGHILVQYESEDVREKVNKMIFVLNEYFNNFSFEEKQHYDFNIENKDFVPVKKENVYQILFKSLTKVIPVLHDDNFNIESIADECKSSLSIAAFEDVKELYKYYRRVARSKQIRFLDGYFDGRIKSIPTMKQIENAYFSGVGSISFKVEDVKTDTLRCYAYKYGNMIGKKISVELSNGVTTLYLNERGLEHRLILKIHDMLDDVEKKSKKYILSVLTKDVDEDKQTIKPTEPSEVYSSKIYIEEKQEPSDDWFPKN